MATIRSAISDDEIIELYRSGYSQNDIVRNYQVSVQRTRSVLQDAGFDTRGYRALSDTMKLVIMTLVRHGVYYLDIERVTDLSVDAIRDYVTRRMEPILNRSKTPPAQRIPSVEEFPARDTLTREYASGDTFCSLAEAHDLTEQDILFFYLSVTDDILTRHRKALRKNILASLAEGASIAQVARKNHISRSLAKKYANPNQKKEPS